MGGMLWAVLARAHGVNLAIAADFAEIAALLSLRRGERYRARAFRNAARLIAGLPVPIMLLDEADRLRLDGIGTTIARAIQQHLDDGCSHYLRELRRREPDGVGVLLQVMGVSVTLARRLSAAGITDVATLRAAVGDGSIRRIGGVGERTAEVIADGIGRLDLKAAARPVLREARLAAAEWAAQIATDPDVQQVVVAGDARRGVAQPDGLRLLVVHSPDAEGPTLAERLMALPGALRAIPSPDGTLSMLTTSGRHLIIDLASPERAGTALVVATGSHAHVQALWAAGMADAADEAAAYRSAGADLRPPPLRERNAPPIPDDLVTLADLSGDGHVHSDWSGDGHDSIDALARAARARGYRWLAITDHAENLTMNGLTREQLQRRDAAIADARPRHPDLRLMAGLELNIGIDGSVDYDPETLAAQDWCVASIHSLFQRREAVQTQRILSAMANPAVDAIGHPFGRMLGVRPGYRIDLHAIAEAAAATDTALEVNGSPRRLDLDAEMVAVAVAAGAPLVIHSDAHSVGELDYVVEATLTAQRGGAPRSAVRNARGEPPRRG